jgi:hypothetical protein
METSILAETGMLQPILGNVYLGQARGEVGYKDAYFIQFIDGPEVEIKREDIAVLTEMRERDVAELIALDMPPQLAHHRNLEVIRLRKWLAEMRKPYGSGNNITVSGSIEVNLPPFTHFGDG